MITTTHPGIVIPKPTIPYLEKFVTGSSLKQTDSLHKAVRLWVTLNSLWGNTLDLVFPITHRQWFNQAIGQQELFTDGLSESTFQQPIDRIPLSYWLFDLGNIHQEAWITNYCQTFLMPRETVIGLLDQYPFFSSAKTIDGIKRHLVNDFKTLAELGCLEEEVITPKRILYHLPQELPTEFTHEVSLLKSQELPSSLSAMLQAENLAEMIKTYNVPINGVNRFFMDLDYIVSSNHGDKVCNHQQLLYEKIWTQTPVPPIQIEYNSMSQGRVLELVTFPVAIYYSKRAPYLCAYGQTPHQTLNQLNWNNFRLDRTLNIRPLPWPADLDELEDELPFELCKAYFNHTLPKPIYIEEELEKAWGFDIGLPSGLMLLRFNRSFHDAYIHTSERHPTFTRLCTSDEIETFIQDLPLNQTDKQGLKTRVLAHITDAFYQAHYRDMDNNIVMRLRSWGPNVEVLFPPQLRQRMQADLHQSKAMYGLDL